jgi:putative transposase
MEQRPVRKTYKYTLKPTLSQERAMGVVLRRCRELYNAGLQERRDAGQKCGICVTADSQSAQLPAIKQACPEYREMHSQVLQDVLTRLDRAFQAFFRRVQQGETPGYPRFQGEQRYNSFTYKQFGNGALLDNGFLVLSKLGRMVVRWSRPLEGMPKTVTISREADGRYVCFSCVEAPIRPLPQTGQETGIDVGLKAFLLTADGTMIANPCHFCREETRLKQAQRVVSRRKKGSKRRRKAVKLLARRHQKVRRQRQDFHHKTALALVRQFDVIYLEDLQVRNMVRNHHLAKSISDAGWGQFRATLEYKAVCAATHVVAIEPAYTSQDCSACGARVRKTLSVRTHICTCCGLVLDRDENAARNILRVGQTHRGAVA